MSGLDEGTPQWDAAVDAVMERFSAPEDYAQRIVATVSESVADRSAPFTVTERDLSVLRYALQAVKSIEERFAGDPLVGVRQGEATSDVLASLIVRLEAASVEESDQ